MAKLTTGTGTTEHAVVPPQEWLAARKELLAKEKEFTRLRDQLSRQRRELPWEKVDKTYVFDGTRGPESLADLFAGKSQLVVYHFMFGPDWKEGCPSCSFWADNFNNIIVHLKQRDVTMLAISRAPIGKIEEFKKRMGWGFKWMSSHANDFNFDYQVSFPPADVQGEPTYNYSKMKAGPTDLVGISVFYKDETGNIFHTYSCYSRGVDMLNTAYHYLDLVPKGRDEDGLKSTQAWVRHHDKYKD